MRRDSDALEPADEDVRRLQETLLAAVVSGEPLPGRERPTVLPDREVIIRKEVVLASDNLAEAFAPESLGRPVRIVSSERIEEEARGSGDLPYLRFQPAAVEDETIWMTLEGRIALASSGQRALGLSGLRVQFGKRGREWVALGDPVMFAA